MLGTRSHGIEFVHEFLLVHERHAVHGHIRIVVDVVFALETLGVDGTIEEIEILSFRIKRGQPVAYSLTVCDHTYLLVSVRIVFLILLDVLYHALDDIHGRSVVDNLFTIQSVFILRIMQLERSYHAGR